MNINSIATTPITCISLEEIGVNEGLRSIANINNSQTKPVWSSYTRFIFNKYIQPLEKTYQVFLILKSDDDSIGYSIARETNKMGTSYLSYIAIKQEHQKKGIGQTLLLETINKIKALNVHTLILDCSGDNRSFYENFASKQDYPIDSFYVGEYENGENKYRLTIHLDSRLSLLQTQ